MTENFIYIAEGVCARDNILFYISWLKTVEHKRGFLNSVLKKPLFLEKVITGHASFVLEQPILFMSETGRLQ